MAIPGLIAKLMVGLSLYLYLSKRAEPYVDSCGYKRVTHWVTYASSMARWHDICTIYVQGSQSVYIRPTFVTAIWYNS